MGVENQAQCYMIKRSWLSAKLRHTWWKFTQWSWWYTHEVAWWIQRQLPEEEKRGKWLEGLHAACWTHVCGHGIGYALQIGNIHWGFFKQEKTN